MKSPLRYQATGYDCGPTSFVNALMFLLDRGEIPPALLRDAHNMALDRHDAAGRAGCEGTSPWAMRFLSAHLDDYAETVGLPLRAAFLAGDEVSLRDGSPVLACLEWGGAVVARVFLSIDDHYVLLTGVEGERIRVFDPYYLAPAEVDAWDGVRVVGDAPFSHNRLVERRVMEEGVRVPYALNCRRPREAVLLERTDL